MATSSVLLQHSFDVINSVVHKIVVAATFVVQMSTVVVYPHVIVLSTIRAGTDARASRLNTLRAVREVELAKLTHELPQSIVALDGLLSKAQMHFECWCHPRLRP